MIIFYLAFNVVCLHLGVLLLEALKPQWVAAYNLRHSSSTEYIIYLLMIAMAYRILKGMVKRFLGIEG